MVDAKARKPHTRGALEEHLSRDGARLIAQRRALLRLMERAGRPLDVEELLERGRREIPNLNRATAYRTITLLKEHGLVDELDLLHRGRSGHYYETVPAEQELHLVCLRCGRVLEMPCGHCEELKAAARREHGFEVTTARLEMGGYCSRCAGRGSERGTNKEGRDEEER